MGMLAKQQQKLALKRQRGEMPIGPILIIALIVLPLVILLVVYGGQIGESFAAATDEVTTANADAKTGLDKGGIKAP